jgi:AraC-like DNA-binding protein
VGFLSIDIEPELLAQPFRGEHMAFCHATALPDLARLCQALDRADSELRANELITALVNAVVDTGALTDAGAARTDAPDRAAIRRAQEFLMARSEGNPRLEEIASAAGLNKFVLLRQFRRSLGTTPHAYLIQLRIERARALLARGASAAEAAATAGFADQPHMTRQFKRLVGLTPGAYARAARALVSRP